MGLGSFYIYKKDLKETKVALNHFIRLELILVILVFSSDLVTEFIYSLQHNNFQSAFIGFIFVSLIGFFTGQELPLIFTLIENFSVDYRVQRGVIVFDYLASFAASVFCTFIFFAYFGVLKTTYLICLINLCILLFLTFKFKEEIQQKYKIITSIIIIPLVLMSFFINKVDHYLHEKIYSFYSNDTLLAREFTAYQSISLFAVDTKSQDRIENIEDVLSDPARYAVHTHLNGAIQFINVLGVKDDPYHTYLIDPFLRLNDKRDDILILGGGDGLPARQVLQYQQIKSIDMVDLDKEWIRFTQTNEIMRMNSNDSLNDPRINLNFSDAFKWMNRSRKTYDFIVVDFPEDFNLASIRTISVQFFNDLKRSITDYGVVVLQCDFDKKPDNDFLQVIYNTGVKANLFPLFGFKKHSNVRDDFVLQLALFKTKQARLDFLEKFNSEYVRDKDNNFVAKYGHVDYQTHFKTDQSGYISFYNPVIISKIFRPDLKKMKEIFYQIFGIYKDDKNRS